MADESGQNDLLKLHRDAMSQFDDITEAEKDQRSQGIEDIQFSQVAGHQWDERAAEVRKNRPRYEINKVALPVAQLVGDQRQSDIGIKVRPFGNGADQKIATTYQGLIRNIQNASRFRNARDIAFKEMATGGYGAWRIVTEFADKESFDFDQDIKIKTIRSALSSVYFDETAVDENKRDARWCYVVDEIPIATFRRLYPNAAVSAIDDQAHKTYHRGWVTETTIRIAEYWRRIPTRKRLLQLSDGRVVEFEQVKDVLDELAAQDPPVTVLREKSVKSHQVLFYKISGAEVLEGPKKWAGKFIPVVPLYGFNHWMDGKHYYRGMVRFAKDAQRVYNYITSARVEAGALAPIDPYWATTAQAMGHETEWARINVSNKPIQFYEEDPKSPGPPKRTGSPAIQSELITQTQQADADIQATTGRFAPSLGDNPANQSGRAIIAQQRQGDVGTFELLDSLSKAVEYTAEILIDLIPKTYDGERQIRVIADDGKTDIVTINQTILDKESGETKLVNDLTVGKYDVAVDVGPSFVTKRAETLEFLQGIMQAVPNISQFILDLVMKNLDFPDAPELEKRMRRFQLAQGFVEPTEEERAEIEANQPEQEGPTPEQMLFAGKLDEIELKNEKTKAETQKTLAEVKKTQSETAENIAQVQKIVTELRQMLGPAGGVVPPQTS